MDRFEAGEESTSTLLKKIIVLVVFVSLMTGTIFYLNESTPDIKRVTLENLARQFSDSVVNAHWQWQAEGRPGIVMLVHYERRLNDDDEPVETDRRPIQMSHLGWPRSESTSEGCGRLWEMVLNVPLEIDGFKVYAEYFEGNDEQGADARCRFRLSVGPYFEYQVNNGHVSKIQD